MYHIYKIRSLTHWGWVTYICVGNVTIIGPDNGVSPGQRQAIIWTNAGILLIGPLGTNLSEIHTFWFKKMRFKLSSGKWRPFCLRLNVLTQWGLVVHIWFNELSHLLFQLMTCSLHKIWNVICKISTILFRRRCVKYYIHHHAQLFPVPIHQPFRKFCEFWSDFYQGLINMLRPLLDHQTQHKRPRVSTKSILWFGVRLQYLQCISNRDTAVLHKAIELCLVVIQGLKAIPINSMAPGRCPCNLKSP